MATSENYYHAPDHFNGTSFLAVNVCMTFQTAATFILGAVPAAAPLIAMTLGVSASYMGIFLALQNIGTFFGSLVCGALIKRMGPVRMTQLALLLGAISLFAFTCPYLIIYAIFGICVGMSDAPIMPAANAILIKTIPRDKLDFWISLKQSSAVVGTAIVSFIVPWIGDRYTWELALWICGGIVVLVVVIGQIWRHKFDKGRDKTQKVDIKTDFENVAMVWHVPRLRKAAIMCLFYEGLQMCLLGFYIVFLVDTPKFTIVYAGLCLSMINVGAFFGRVFFGWLGSATHKPKLILGWIGVFMGILTAALMLVDLSWSEWSVIGFCIISGFVILGWKGIWLALVAREAPLGKVPAATGGCDFISYIGAILLPILIEVIEIFTGSYKIGFWIVSAMATATGIWYLIFHAPSLYGPDGQLLNPPTPQPPTGVPKPEDSVRPAPTGPVPKTSDFVVPAGLPPKEEMTSSAPASAQTQTSFASSSQTSEAPSGASAIKPPSPQQPTGPNQPNGTSSGPGQK